MPAKASKASKRKRGKSAIRAQPVVPQPLHPNTKLDLALSTQIVQTAVAAIFFQIIHIRKVFKDHPWQPRIYHPEDPNNSYDAYVNRQDFAPPPHEYMYWRVPKRGEGEQVDKLMNVLESVAKEPIEKRYLQKLQLCFHTADGQEVSENNLIESYCLTFEYVNGRASSRLSERVRNAVTQEFTTLVLSEGRRKLIDMAEELFKRLGHTDRFGRLTQYPLPADYRLNILAEYNDSAPTSYQPTYFKPGNLATEALLSLCNSDPELSMDTGHHRISAGLLLPSSGSSPARMPQRQILAHSNTSPAESRAPSQPIGRLESSQPPQKRGHYLRLGSINGDGIQREMSHRLQTMGDSRAQHHFTQDTQHLQKDQSLPRQSQQAQSEPVVAPPYTQDIMNYFNSRLAEHTGAAGDDDLDGPQSIGYNGDRIVECECGCQENGPSMIYCVDCRRSQHSECYGYLDGEGPSNHLCYSCLAEIYKEEKQQITAASELCVGRHILWFLRNKRVAVSFSELVDYLGRSLEFTEELMEVLELSGFVQKLNKTKQLRNQTFRYIGNDDSLREEYFQPQRYINHLFAIPDAPRLGKLADPKSSIALDDFNTPNAKASGPAHVFDDGTTEGEPSPRLSTCGTPLPSDNEFHHLQSIARRGLLFSPNETGRRASKRFAESHSPVEAVKRMRTSRASPILESTGLN